MKRASIVLVTISVVMIVIGGVLSIVALAQGARYYGAFHISMREMVTREYSNFEPIKDINVDVDVATLKVIVGDEFKVIINSNTNQSFKVGVTNQRLDIIENSSNRWGIFNIGLGGYKTTIDLYIPRNYQLDDVTIESNASNIDIDQLIAESVSLEANVGKITVDEIKTESLSVEVNAGKVDVEGVVDGNINVNCNVGSVYLNLTGDEADYQVSGSVDVGNFKFNNNSHGGVLNSDFNFGNGKYKIDVDCDAGSVNIKIN